MMQKRLWVRGYRAGFGIMILVAIVAQFSYGTERPDFLAANFLSFFTIQSNLIGAAVLLLGATVMANRPPSLAWDLIRGGTVMWLTTTFFVYAILLSGLEEALEMTMPWVNTVLHQISPVVVIVDLLIVPLAHRIGSRQALLWTIYPILYLVYSLIRGPIVGWYPYPFLDPDTAGGYPGVAVYSVVILAGFIGFAIVIVWVSQHLRLQHQEDVTRAMTEPA